jgi:hypothetical protein
MTWYTYLQDNDALLSHAYDLLYHSIITEGTRLLPSTIARYKKQGFLFDLDRPIDMYYSHVNLLSRASTGEPVPAVPLKQNVLPARISEKNTVLFSPLKDVNVKDENTLILTEPIQPSPAKASVLAANPWKWMGRGKRSRKRRPQTRRSKCRRHTHKRKP